jgi:hypothetical protein
MFSCDFFLVNAMIWVSESERIILKFLVENYILFIKIK